jgi:hypothetical protein
MDHGKPQLGWTQADRSSDSVKEACHLKDRNNSGGLCWLIENLVDFSWRPTSKIVFQMASLFHRMAAGSIECPSQLRLPVIESRRTREFEGEPDESKETPCTRRYCIA